MRYIGLAIFMLFITGTVSAELPRLAVVSNDIDDFAPDSVILGIVQNEFAESGRFQVVDLGDDSYLETSPDSLLNLFRILASERNIDIIAAMEMFYQEDSDRTVFRNDSLVTFRTVSVDVLARFYSSTGTLIGTIRNTVRREAVLPYTPDRYRLATLSAEELASRAMLELFPVEIVFTASNSEVFTVPFGTDHGISKGTVMAVVASSTGIPDNISEYRQLRSRGLLQILEARSSQSTARLISGQLIEGGTVTAIEQTSPALFFLEYCGSMMSVEPGTGLEDNTSEWSNNVRLGIETAKWGLSFGGGVTGGGLEYSSMIGIDLQAGTRIPLNSPSLGLRLSAGGQLAFLMQDVRSDILASSATAVSLAAVADATMEYLFSGHLGFQIGISGILGTSVESWTVREYSGYIRDAEPYELYYTEMKQDPIGVHAGLMYFIF